MNIVLADDEALVVRGISQQLVKYKPMWTVVGKAKDGESALEILRQQHVDVLITDIRMPRKNGLELAEEAITLQSDLKVVVLTGYAEFEYAQQAIRCGIVDYLLKPIDYMGLIEKIESLEKDIEIKPDHLTRLSVSERAVRYIEANYYDSALSLTDVAEELEMSSQHFCRLFKQEQGELFSKFLTNIRIEKAKKLLIEEAYMKVYEIGEAVGYIDRHYFSQTFKKNVGMTPNEYKNEALDSNNE